MEFILIRHGQSESNARLTLALDAVLTELGQSQAVATANALLDKLIVNDLSRCSVYASPFRRTLQTSAPFAERSGLTVLAYPDLCEYFNSHNAAYQSFTGITSGERAEEFPFVADDSSFPCPPNWWPSTPEDVQAIYQRACRVRDTLYRRYCASAAQEIGCGAQQVIIFSHAEPIGRLIEAMLHSQPSQGWPPWTENCGINRLTVTDPTLPADLTVQNDTSHLQVLGIVSPTHPGIDASPEQPFVMPAGSVCDAPA